MATPAAPIILPTSAVSAGVRATPQPSTSQAPADTPRGQVAYIGEDGRLQTLDLTTGQSERLAGDERVWSLAWSPDGTRIACVREASLSKDRELVLLDVLSQTQTVLPEARSPFLASATWSPDGRFIVADIGCCAVGRELVLYNVADGSVWSVYRKIGISLGYAWSPDGSRLAYGVGVPLETPIAVEPGDSSSVVVYDLSTGTIDTVLRGTRQAIYSPECWSSDGVLAYHKLAYDEVTQTTQHSRWRMVVGSGDKSVELVPDETPVCKDDAMLSLLPADLRAKAGITSRSPDGQWAVFAMSDEVHPGVHYGIYLLHVASRTVRRLADGTAPAWRPG